MLANTRLRVISYAKVCCSEALVDGGAGWQEGRRWCIRPPACPAVCSSCVAAVLLVCSACFPPLCTTCPAALASTVPALCRRRPRTFQVLMTDIQSITAVGGRWTPAACCCGCHGSHRRSGLSSAMAARGACTAWMPDPTCPSHIHAAGALCSRLLPRRAQRLQVRPYSLTHTSRGSLMITSVGGRKRLLCRQLQITRGGRRGRWVPP